MKRTESYTYETFTFKAIYEKFFLNRFCTLAETCRFVYHISLGLSRLMKQKPLVENMTPYFLHYATLIFKQRLQPLCFEARKESYDHGNVSCKYSSVFACEMLDMRWQKHVKMCITSPYNVTKTRDDHWTFLLLRGIQTL